MCEMIALIDIVIMLVALGVWMGTGLVLFYAILRLTWVSATVLLTPQKPDRIRRIP